MAGRDRGTRRPRSNSRTQHRLGVAGSVLLGLASLIVIGIGAFAWSMPSPGKIPVPAGQPVALAASPWFSQGSTLFTVPFGPLPQDEPPTQSFGCTLHQGGTSDELVNASDPDTAGSRVVEGRSLIPVLVIGPTQAGAVLTCSGPAAQQSTKLWSLPTNPGIPRVPVSLIVVGIALAGLAALVHPRGRGVVPFGR